MLQKGLHDFWRHYTRGKLHTSDESCTDSNHDRCSIMRSVIRTLRVMSQNVREDDSTHHSRVFNCPSAKGQTRATWVVELQESYVYGERFESGAARTSDWAKIESWGDLSRVGSSTCEELAKYTRTVHLCQQTLQSERANRTELLIRSFMRMGLQTVLVFTVHHALMPIWYILALPLLVYFFTFQCWCWYFSPATLHSRLLSDIFRVCKEKQHIARHRRTTFVSYSYGMPLQTCSFLLFLLIFITFLLFKIVCTTNEKHQVLFSAEYAQHNRSCSVHDHVRLLFLRVRYRIW